MKLFKSPKRILVIEDHSMVAEMICETLKRSGYDMVAAGFGIQGLQQMERYPCDLVLMDIKLPDQDGISLLEKFKKRHPEVPVIILTGMEGDEALMKKAMDLGATAFLGKSSHLQQILQTVEQALTKPA